MSLKGNIFNQGYYGNINTLSVCRPVLLSGDVQSEHVAAGEMVQKRYYRNINTLASVGQRYFQVTSNLNMSLQGKFSNNDIIGTFTL